MTKSETTKSREINVIVDRWRLAAENEWNGKCCKIGTWICCVCDNATICRECYHSMCGKKMCLGCFLRSVEAIGTAARELKK